MADQALHGVGLGVKNFEGEQGTRFAKRSQVKSDCPKDHHFEIAFAVEAGLSFEWKCKWHGQMTKRSDGTMGGAKEMKPPRTRQDMLCRRRGIPELEDILTEQLDRLRDSTN